MDVLLVIGMFYGIYWVLNKLVNSAPKPPQRKRNVNSRYKSTYSSSYRSGYAPRPSVDTGVPIKDRKSPTGTFRPSGRKTSDFNYLDNPNPDEFLVYFIASEELNALKIGVGTSGRVLQLLTSTIKTEEGIKNVGWKVLKTAKFSSSFDDYESGRLKGYEAERRVLYYWRKHLGLKSYVSEEEMGWSELFYKGNKGWHRTKGFTETVEMGEVCETSTWKIVMNSPGYLGEGSSFFQDRELKFNADASIDGKVAKGYFEYKRQLESSSGGRTPSVDAAPAGVEAIQRSQSIPLTRRTYKHYAQGDGTSEGRFWARVNKNSTGGCWEWNGPIMTDVGYGTVFWNGSPRPAHRIAWQLVVGEPSKDAFLKNQCGSRTCVNPAHWEELVKEQRTCITSDCDGISTTKIVDGYCQRCLDRRKRERRKNRGYKYSCISQGCNNPSPIQTHRAKCNQCIEKGK